MSARLALIFCLLVSLMVLLPVVSPLNSGYLCSKSYTTLQVERGPHIVLFSSNCSLVLGSIPEDNVAELVHLPNSIPSKFAILAVSSCCYTSDYNIILHDNSYLVLFNNGSFNCKYSSFSSQLYVGSLDEDKHSYVLQYGVIEPFSLTYGYFYDAHITSNSDSIMTLKYYTETRREAPSSIGMLNPNHFKEVTIEPKAIVTIPTINSGQLDSYIYFYCMDAKGCPVDLSSTKIIYDPSSDIAVGIVVPLLCIGVFSLIAIIIIFSILRKRRMDSEFTKEPAQSTVESINTERV